MADPERCDAMAAMRARMGAINQPADHAALLELMLPYDKTWVAKAYGSVPARVL